MRDNGEKLITKLMDITFNIMIVSLILVFTCFKIIVENITKKNIFLNYYIFICPAIKTY